MTDSVPFRPRLAWPSAWIVTLGLSALGCGAESDEPPPSVILIMVDTLRADHLGFSGYERPTSPQLDEWTRSGLVFENALATSPWTLPSFVSVFTGQLPSLHGAGRIGDGEERKFSALKATLPTLAEKLGEKGLTTGAIVNNPFLSPSFGVARGFEHYDHDSGGNQEIRRADEIVDRGLAWLDAQADAPFFLLLHFFDPHLDYDAPEPVRGTFTAGIETGLAYDHETWDALRKGELELGPQDERYVVAAYDEELLYLDAQLGRLRRGLEERGLLDRALVVFTADHGEELFEHGDFEHGHEMWQEILHVPMVFWGVGVRSGRDATPVSLVDVAPTILEAAGIRPAEGIAGRSLWPSLRGDGALAVRSVFAEGNLYGPELKTLLRWPYKLVKPRGKDAPGRLYDLAVDPHEKRDLADAHPEIVEELLEELRVTIKEARTIRKSLRDEAELDEETRERLKSLGYVE